MTVDPAGQPSVVEPDQPRPRLSGAGADLGEDDDERGSELASSPPAEMVLHQERAVIVRGRRTPTERVVLRKRIVTEQRTVEVTVRREELQVERLPVDSHAPDGAGPGPAAGAEPLTFVLSEEVPVIELRTQPYERVTVHVDTGTRDEQGSTELRHEQVELLGDTTEPRAGGVDADVAGTGAP